MERLYFEDGTYLQYLDLTDQLNMDETWVRKTSDSPLLVEIKEIPDCIPIKLPYGTPTKELAYKNPVIESYIARATTTGSRYDYITISDIASKVWVTDYPEDEGYSPDKALYASADNKISFASNGLNISPTNSLPYEMFKDGIGETPIGYKDFLLNATGYTYLAKVKARRVDATDSLVYNYGYILFALNSPIEMKTYKLITSLNTQNYVEDNVDEYNDWINVHYTYQLRTRTSQYYKTGWGGRYWSGFSPPPNRVDESIINSLPEFARINEYLKTYFLYSIEQGIANSNKPRRKELIGLNDLMNAGFYKLYATDDLNDLKNLNDEFWKTEFFNSLENYNMLNSVLSFGFIPIQITPGSTVDAEGNIIINGGKSPLTISGRNVPGVNWHVVNKQYIEFRLDAFYYEGKYIDKPWHYLDFAPYSSCIINLPYVGTYNINPNDVMSRFLKPVYKIDLFTGMCTVILYRTTGTHNKTDNPNFPNAYEPLSTYNGSCLVNLPLSSSNYAEFNIAQQTINNQVQSAFLSTASAVIGNATEAGINIAGSYASKKPVDKGGILNNIGDIGENISNYYIKEFEASRARELVTYPAASVSYGGSSAGVTGVMSPQTIYLQIKTPTVNEQIANDFIKFHGIQCYKKYTIGNNRFGYLRAEKVNFDLQTTGGEIVPDMRSIEEIEMFLKGGIYHDNNSAL